MLYKAFVSGTVAIEVPVEGGGTKPQVSVLNNARLFTEFGVSKTDYALVWDGSRLIFTPKAPGVIREIFRSTDAHQLTNSAGESGRILGPVTSTQATGLFSGLEGTLSGKLKFGEGEYALAINVVANGTNPAPTTGNIDAHLKFTVTTGKEFIPPAP